MGVYPRVHAPVGILCFDSAINRREAAVKRIESQVRSADVVKWLDIRRTVSQSGETSSDASLHVTCFAIGDTTRCGSDNLSTYHVTIVSLSSL